MQNLFRTRIILALILCCSFIITVSACTLPDNSSGQPVSPNIIVKTQPKATNLCLYVDRTHEASFSIPVIVNTDLSMFNTNTSSTNDKLYVVDVKGNNLGDLDINGLQYNCFSSTNSADYVCTFNFTVKADKSWISKNVVREIVKISFNIIDKTIDVPVNIKIFESIQNVAYINNCDILLQDKYLTLSNRLVDYIEEDSSFTLALNWDITGWGASDYTDENYATIVGFRFANDLLKLTSFSILVDNEEGNQIDPQVVSLDLSNVKYDLLSKQCYWSGNFVMFEVAMSDIAEGYKVVSDSLIMQYTKNGGNDIYEVNLANVQLYNYDALLSINS